MMKLYGIEGEIIPTIKLKWYALENDSLNVQWGIKQAEIQARLDCIAFRYKEKITEDINKLKKEFIELDT